MYVAFGGSTATAVVDNTTVALVNLYVGGSGGNDTGTGVLNIVEPGRGDLGRGRCIGWGAAGATAT